MTVSTPGQSVAVTEQPGAAAGYPLRWLAAIVMIVGALMDMIDVTIVNVALPTIRRDLHASATQLEWVVSGYMLAFAAALIIAGNFGDLFGRKKVFLVGVAVFGLASLAAGLSQTGAELIAARVVQGTAAARLASPNTATPIRKTFFRPNRSPKFPAMISAAAKASMYPDTTHSSWVALACRSRRIVGRATFTIVTSIMSMSAPTIITIAASHRRGYAPAAVGRPVAAI